MATTTAEVTLTKGDKGFDLTFNVKDDDDAAVNLSGSTIKFKMEKPGDSTSQIDGSCVITDASGGVCTYTIGATDLSTVGTYNGELEISFSADHIVTVRNIVVIVKGES